MMNVNWKVAFLKMGMFHMSFGSDFNSSVAVQDGEICETLNLSIS